MSDTALCQDADSPPETSPAAAEGMAGDPAGIPAGDPGATAGGPARLSRRSRVLLAVISLLIALITGTQAAVLFLTAAPTNAISQKYAKQLDWWSNPWLEQNWKLFAPNPQSFNNTIAVRVRTPGGTMSQWVDLSAIDYRAIQHDLMPSHANANELRRAWQGYAAGGSGSPTGELLRQYLVNIALGRLRGVVAGSYDAVQFQVTTTAIAAPGSIARPTPSVQTLPWWPVADPQSHPQSEPQNNP